MIGTDENRAVLHVEVICWSGNRKVPPSLVRGKYCPHFVVTGTAEYLGVCFLDGDECAFSEPALGTAQPLYPDTVDYSAPVVLTYGVHTLHAEAEGYDDFDKKLFVNSAASNIDISLTGDGTTSDNDKTEGTESVEETETAETETKDSEEETKSTEKDSETSDKSTDKDVTSDYLSTLSDLITSLNK